MAEGDIYETMSDEEWRKRKQKPEKEDSIFEREREARVDEQELIRKKRAPRGIPNKGTNGKVFYNPKSGEFYVPHLSKKRPENPNEFYDVTGTKAAVKGRSIESEKYNERKKRQKAGKKASRTRKKNEFKKSAEGKIEWFGSGAKKIGGAAKSAGGFIKSKGTGAGGIIKKKGTDKWRSHKKNVWRRKDEAHPEYTHPGGMRGALQRTGRTVGNFGYALPGPFQVFTLAWRKMTKVMKALIILVFAVVIFFVPWGVFYYSGWAVGAGFMFLISSIYWVFITLFNSVASALVMLINGAARIVMGSIIGAVQWVTSHLIDSEYNTWVKGNELMNKALISFEDIADPIELMTVVKPDWQPWMNNTIIHQILFEIFEVDYPLTWISKPISDFYAGLDPTQSMMVGIAFIAIPIGILIYVYWKNRFHLR